MSHEIINAGYKMFAKALPAVLVDSKANSTILGAWLVASRINVNELPTPEKVAAALRQSVEATYRRLEWKVAPKRLLVEIENEKRVNLVTASQDENLFAEKLKQDEAKKAQDKADAAALKTVAGLIASLQLDSARKNEKFRIALTARVSRLKQFGQTGPEIEADIRGKIDLIYRTAEREVEFVGVHRDLLSGIEV